MTAGILAFPERRKPIADRFWGKVVRIPESGCWVWLGGCSGDGYGVLMEGNGSEKLKYAHRVSYELHVGPVPDGLELDHLCRVRCCVNPDHLQPVTRKVNINRGAVADVHRARYALITHCPRGHPYEGENLYLHPNGCRICRTCQRERRAAKRAL